MASGPRFYAPYFQALDGLGEPIPGALLNFYLTTSDTRTPTYANAALSVANTNPVQADDTGTFPNIFLDPSITYKVVLTGPDDGITDPVQIWTADPVSEAWLPGSTVYFDLPFEWLGPPGNASEVMAMFTAIRPMTFFADFDGTSVGQAKAFGNCASPPADGNVLVNIYLNGVSGTPVGTMTVMVSSGEFVFGTTGGTQLSIDTGDFLAFVGPAGPDSSFANAAWTLPGFDS